jgi:hypothetical protein
MPTSTPAARARNRRHDLHRHIAPPESLDYQTTYATRYKGIDHGGTAPHAQRHDLHGGFRIDQR